MKTKSGRLALLAAVVAAVPSIAAAQTTWDGGGAADTSWGTATNWNNDLLPAFDGTDSLSVTAGFGANTALTLGADRSIGRITFGGGSTPISLSGNTLRLNSTTTTAATGAALWNASTADGQAATVNSAVLLQSGTAGTYTAQFRENGNSSGGTTFNGAITQGAGENWTLRFSRASSRGTFRLNNAANSFAGIINAGADLLSLTPGSYGAGPITLSGGTTGTSTVDHFTTPVANDIALTTGGTWSSSIATRLTGNLTQGGNTLTYQGGSLTRVEYASVSGSGQTAINSGALAVSDMSKLSSGTLNLNNAGSGQGVLVLSGSSGNNVPTWSDFAGSRTYNQAGGAGTWRINVAASGGQAGGFAARGADLVIPASGGGLTNATFARNFALGSNASQGGSRYADHAVIIETDIAYATPGTNYEIWVANNTEVVRSETDWTFGGPIHELRGQITGDNIGIIPYASTTSSGMVRVTNATNAITNIAGSSAWVLGATRGTLTTPSGRSVGGGNHKDNSNAVFIFTSDGAFGGAADVMVNAVSSSGSSAAGYLFLEDTNLIDNTVFGRNFTVNATNGNGAGFGAWGGDVVYRGNGTTTGVITLTGSENDLPLSAENASTFTFGSSGGDAATIVNNRSNATTLNKGGTGTVIIENLVFSGSQATNNWSVRGGTLLVNQALTTVVTVANTGTLGGIGSVSGAVTVQSGGTVAPGMSIGNLTVGSLIVQNGGTVDVEVGASAADLLSVTGVLNLTAGTDALNLSSLLGGPTGAVPTYTILTYASRSGDFNVVSLDDVVVSTADAFDPLVGVPFPSTNYYLAWDDSAGTLTLNAVPEPASLGLLAMGGLAMLRRRRGA